MTLTNAYCTQADLTDALGAATTLNDLGDRVINAASRWIDQYCGRYFYQDTGTTARLYRPNAAGDRGSRWQRGGVFVLRVFVDDISTTTGLVVKSDPSNSGSFTTTWATTDYELEPLNGVGCDGATGWPYSSILAVGTQQFTDWRNGWWVAPRPSVQVTAQWGWAAVPAGVTQACVSLAEFLYKTKDSPSGYTGIADLGIARVTMPSHISDLLYPYVKGGLAVPSIA